MPPTLSIADFEELRAFRGQAEVEKIRAEVQAQLAWQMLAMVMVCGAMDQTRAHLPQRQKDWFRPGPVCLARTGASGH